MPARRPIRIAHVITGLGAGGAERMLCNLALGLDRSRFESHVIALSREQTLAGTLRGGGIPVTIAGAHAYKSLGLGPLHRVLQILRAERPDIVQTWMFHADLVGGIAGRIVGAPVIWNIRASLADSGWHPLASSVRQRVIARVCAVLSGAIPRYIVSSSLANVSRSLRGYRREKICIINNGVDVDLFKPDPGSRAQLRSELGVGEDTPLVGMVTRFHPVKDFGTFLSAARQVVEAHPRVRFLLCGSGMQLENDALTRIIRSHGLERTVLRLGFREDVARVFTALDVHIVSSKSEGFGNVLMEAMAAGVPCVATDVGEARFIAGDTGSIVPRGNPAALASAARQLIDLPPLEMAALRVKARERVVGHFTMKTMIDRYANLYESVVCS
jgi:glycosyltransferase involved in cell wall biosynthesis